MLETEEVDVDYFTPAERLAERLPNYMGNGRLDLSRHFYKTYFIKAVSLISFTTLANIFAKSSVPEDKKDNTSLKYVPLPPPEKSKPEEEKPTQWIFTCAVHGFEWSTSGYISRGKLGMAILKVVKTNSHSIILYDSNKATVSYVTVDSKLNIHKRDALSISYYDNVKKYWSIQTSDDDMNKMLQLLKSLHATIVYKSYQETDREQSDNNKLHKENVVLKDETHEDEHEIDTDFYMNQKTKDSILKRMATMGHSVLPPHGMSKGHTSDSSDSNDIDDGKKNIRHKPAKIGPKKSVDTQDNEGTANVVCHSRKLTHKIHIDGQASTSKNITAYGDEINSFICEQRMNNSELRMNVIRMSDKIDNMIDRLNEVINVDKSTSSSVFQNEIVQKLIKEYEDKIRNYENVMNSKGINYSSNSSVNENDMNYMCKDGVAHINQFDELQKKCVENEKIIATLQKEIKLLSENNEKMIENHEEKRNEMINEIKILNENLSLRNKEIDTIKNSSYQSVIASNQESADIANKLKKIMNDTYQAISINFDDNLTYSGEEIKAIIATVIKKTTIEALHEL